jgi:hypothetical protein
MTANRRICELVIDVISGWAESKKRAAMVAMRFAAKPPDKSSTGRNGSVLRQMAACGHRYSEDISDARSDAKNSAEPR